MTTRRSYAGGAQAGALTSPINISDVDISCDVLTGWPDGSAGQFAAVIGRGLPNEEKILVDTRTGAALTVSIRGYDGTPPSAHAATEVIEHVHTAIDDDEANDHSSNPYGHGIPDTDRIVGLNKTQTLTHKTMSGAENTFLDIPSTAIPEVDDRLDTLEDDVDNVYTKAEVYTKTETDGRYEPLDSAYTKVEADGRFEPLDSAYTKAESDLRYAPAGTYMTQAQADLRYARLWVDSGWLTANPTIPFIAQPGWTLNSLRYRTLVSGAYRIADVLVTLTKTSPAITNPTSGNVAATDVVLFPPPMWPDRDVNMVSPNSVGRVAVAQLSATDGNATLQAIGGSTDFAIGEQVSLHAIYFMAPP